MATVHKPKDTITLQDFYNISSLLERFDELLVYRSAFALLFYGFLRISNLVPPTRNAFDHSRQLNRSDVSFTSHGVCIFLKWANNLQKTQQSHVIILPNMQTPILSPFHILQTLFKSQSYAPQHLVIKTYKYLFANSETMQQVPQFANKYL